MKRTILFVASCCAMACDNKPASAPSVDAKPKISFVHQSLKDSSKAFEKDDFGRDVRSKVNAQWVEISGGKQEATEKINADIVGELKKIISSFSPEAEKENVAKESIQETAKNFIKDSEEVNEEFGESGAWNLSVNVDTSYVSTSMISFELSFESYTGGAHGFNASSFMHYNLETGEELALTDMITDTLAFMKLLEQSLRDDRELSETQPLSDGGLFEEFNGGLPMPTQISFTQDGLVAIYNSYEVAPYSVGPVVIELTDGELAPLLKGGKKP